jgi:hypothetical protein
VFLTIRVAIRTFEGNLEVDARRKSDLPTGGTGIEGGGGHEPGASALPPTPEVKPVRCNPRHRNSSNRRFVDIAMIDSRCSSRQSHVRFPRDASAAQLRTQRELRNCLDVSYLHTAEMTRHPTV